MMETDDRLVMIDRGVSRGSHFVCPPSGISHVEILMIRSNAHYKEKPVLLPLHSRFSECESPAPCTRPFELTIQLHNLDHSVSRASSF